jgi:hypothetical protein
MADLTQTAANVVVVSGGERKSGIAGATIEAGNVLYLDATVSTLKLADAGDTVEKAVVEGIAICDAASGQPIFYFAGTGVINVGATLAIGQTYVLSSANPGKIALEEDLGEGDFVTILGVGQTVANFAYKANISGVAHAAVI